jgi:hypothetical protein
MKENSLWRTVMDAGHGSDHAPVNDRAGRNVAGAWMPSSDQRRAPVAGSMMTSAPVIGSRMVMTVLPVHADRKRRTPAPDQLHLLLWLSDG